MNLTFSGPHLELYSQDEEPEVDDQESEPESKKFHYVKPEIKLSSSQSSEVDEEQYDNESIDNKVQAKNNLLKYFPKLDEKLDQKPILQEKHTEDEFDLLGKKIAHQIRDISKKNKRKAREIEIKFLQLMMEAEM